jgi:hypothetical protein
MAGSPNHVDVCGRIFPMLYRLREVDRVFPARRANPALFGGIDERNECNRLSHARKARGGLSCSEAYRPTDTWNKTAKVV